MRKVLVGVTVLGTLFGSAQPASALAFKTAGISGGLSVGSDFSVCASLTFSGGGVIVGEFAAVGEMQGPGTRVGTVRGAQIIFSTTGSWSGCIPGAYTGATVGDAKFTLSASAATDDYVEVRQCVINNGHLTCV